MSLHLADGFTNFATFFVPAILLALADRAKPEKHVEPDDTNSEVGKQP